MRAARFLFAVSFALVLASACSSPAPPAGHVIFLDFDGVTLQPGADDAANNRSSIAARLGQTLRVPPFDAGLYGGDRAAAIATLLAQVRSYYADFAVDIVAARPMNTNRYVLTAVGGTPDVVGEPCSAGGCAIGKAPLDCRPPAMPGGAILYNVQGDVEPVVIFSDDAKYDTLPVATRLRNLATTIAQESAHSYGLGHTTNPADLMFPDVSERATGFSRGSYADGSNCNNGIGMQDSHGVLLAVLGPRR